jgi:hypothetical protein
MLSGWAPAGMTYRDIVKKGMAVAPVSVAPASCGRPPVPADVASFAAASGVALDKLETYLKREDFVRVLECAPEEFAALPEWKQRSLKKKLRLHVPVGTSA